MGTEREPGFYWVRTDTRFPPVIAHWDQFDKLWRAVGVSGTWGDSAFAWIGPRIPDYQPDQPERSET